MYRERANPTNYMNNTDGKGATFSFSLPVS